MSLEQPTPEAQPQGNSVPEEAAAPGAHPTQAMQERVDAMEQKLSQAKNSAADTSATIQAPEKEDSTEREKSEDAEVTEKLRMRREELTRNIKMRMQGASSNIAESEKTIKEQWFFQRWGSNEKSSIAEMRSYHAQLQNILTQLDTLCGQATDAPARRCLLTMLNDTKGPLMSQLLAAKPDFAKLRSEFERTQQILNYTEQGLQLAQQGLEIAASYGGPAALAAALIPKYIVELTTGQTTSEQLAWKIVEDIVTSYIGGGKYLKPFLKKMGPLVDAVQKIFEAGKKQGWTATIIKKTVIEFIDMFKDQQVQHLFADFRENVTGEESHRVTMEEMAIGRAMGKMIGKGLEKSGVKGKIEETALGEPKTDSDGTAVKKRPELTEKRKE